MVTKKKRLNNKKAFHVLSHQLLGGKKNKRRRTKKGKNKRRRTNRRQTKRKNINKNKFKMKGVNSKKNCMIGGGCNLNLEDPGIVIASGGFGTIYQHTLDRCNAVTTTCDIDDHTCCMEDKNNKCSNTLAVKKPNNPGECEDINKEWNFIKNHLLHLDHSNIQKFYKTNIQNNCKIYSDYVGKTLDDLLSYSEEIDINVCSSVMQDITAAVDFLHEKLIVHLDIKPKNITYDYKPDSNKNKYKFVLIDFGLAKKLINKDSKLNNYVGTHGYIHPHVMNEIPYNFEADIYSLGVVYFLLMYYFLYMWNLNQNEIDGLNLLTINDIFNYLYTITSSTNNIQNDMNIVEINSSSVANIEKYIKLINQSYKIDFLSTFFSAASDSIQNFSNFAYEMSQIKSKDSN